jgi:hypothetical protein
MRFIKNHWLSIFWATVIGIQLICLSYRAYTNEDDLLAYVIFVPIIYLFTLVTVFYRNNQIKKLEERLDKYEQC